MSATFFTLLLFGLAIASILPLPVWALRRANRQRPYKAVLFVVFALTSAWFYTAFSFSHYLSPEVQVYVAMIGLYGVASFILSLVFVLSVQHAFWQEFWQEFSERMTEHEYEQDDGHGPGYGSGYRPGEGYGYGYRPGQGYGYGRRNNF